MAPTLDFFSFFLHKSPENHCFYHVLLFLLQTGFFLRICQKNHLWQKTKKEKKKKKIRPTYPNFFGHVTGNKPLFCLGLIVLRDSRIEKWIPTSNIITIHSFFLFFLVGVLVIASTAQTFIKTHKTTTPHRLRTCIVECDIDFKFSRVVVQSNKSTRAV